MLDLRIIKIRVINDAQARVTLGPTWPLATFGALFALMNVTFTWLALRDGAWPMLAASGPFTVIGATLLAQSLKRWTFERTEAALVVREARLFGGRTYRFPSDSSARLELAPRRRRSARYYYELLFHDGSRTIATGYWLDVETARRVLAALSFDPEPPQPAD